MRKSIIVIFTAILLSACSTSAKLYPIEGPFFDNKNIQAIEANVKGVEGNDGDISMILPSGEIMEGSWSVVAPKTMTSSWGSLFTSYGNLNSSSTSISTLAGANKGAAYLVGNQGTTMDVEFTVGSGTADGNGFAKDSNGNIYRLIF